MECRAGFAAAIRSRSLAPTGAGLHAIPGVMVRLIAGSIPDLDLPSHRINRFRGSPHEPQGLSCHRRRTRYRSRCRLQEARAWLCARPQAALPKLRDTRPGTGLPRPARCRAKRDRPEGRGGPCACHAWPDRGRPPARRPQRATFWRSATRPGTSPMTCPKIGDLQGQPRDPGDGDAGRELHRRHHHHASHEPSDWFPARCTCPAAVSTFTKRQSNRCGPQNSRLNCLAPGCADSPEMAKRGELAARTVSAGCGNRPGRQHCC